jgi:hypothetical protein
MVLVDKADMFYKQRYQKCMLKQCFDALRLGMKETMVKMLQQKWLHGVRYTNLKRQCLTQLQMFAKMSKKQKYAVKVMTQKVGKRVKSQVLEELFMNSIEGGKLNVFKSKLQESYHRILRRKVFVALQIYTVREQRAKVVFEKYKLQAYDKFFTRW